MDWNGSMRPFVPRAESSFSFLYDYNSTPYPGMEVKHPAFAERPPQGLLEEMEKMRYGGGNQQQLEKKKRLTGEQLEALERSFQEEIKLEPDRKMKLSRELGLQPRQIAVWFQNRRARWKAKQIEHLYGNLKQEFDVVSKQNQKLQEEVMKLRAMVREQAYCRTQQVSAEMSGDETVESTSEAMLLRRSKTAGTIQQQHMTAEANYSLTAEEYCNTVSLPHWAVVPYYP